jgi:hypothetical protein
LEDLPRYTHDDYVQWKGQWELICGVAYAMSTTPSITHQSISQHIASQLESALENCQTVKFDFGKCIIPFESAKMCF